MVEKSLIIMCTVEINCYFRIVYKEKKISIKQGIVDFLCLSLLFIRTSVEGTINWGERH